MRRALLTLSAMAPTACVVAPIDPIPAALRAAEDGDLLRALAYVDHLPRVHPRYAEARAFAQAIEARITQSQRWLAEGLRLRADGDINMSLAALEQARDSWPGAIGVQQWIETISVEIGASVPSRDAVLAHAPLSPRPDLRSEPTAPTGQGPAPLSNQPAAEAPTARHLPKLADLPPPPAVLGERAAASGWVVSAPTIRRDEPASVEVRGASAAPDRVHSGASTMQPVSNTELAGLRALVRGRDKTRAITHLSDAHATYPENSEVRTMLAGLLRQRALVAYGRGWLDAALDDWERVTALVPEDHTAFAYLAVAREEITRRREAERRKNAGG